MNKVRVGYRRLYDAMGCSISCQKEWSATFPIGDLNAEVYLGPNPKYGVAYFTVPTPKYQIPGESTSFGSFEYQQEAAKSSYPRDFFTEIIVFKDIIFEEDLYQLFMQGDSNAVNSTLDCASQNESQLRKMAEVIAGSIGLRFHCQFVMELIAENLFALRNDGTWSFRIVSPSMQMLEPVLITQDGIQALDTLLPNIGQSTAKALRFGSKALEWLLKAWVERDPVSKFVFLFIALEVGLSHISKDQIPTSEATFRVKSLIESSGDETKEEDLRYLEMAVRALEDQPLSLPRRFEILAQAGKLLGWEQDIVAFKKFNRIRNNLFHQGDSTIRLSVTISEDEVRQLRDLSERYVSLALFGDGLVYRSQYRDVNESM